MLGERIHQLAGFKKAKLAAALTLLAPYIPLLYMGEELHCKTQFYYLFDHSDKELIEAVRKGRREEFSHFKWDTEPPDPYSVETFKKSMINVDAHLNKKEHKEMLT